MIKDPPLLTIRRNFPRPSAGEVAAFADVPTGYVVDAMGGRGALDYRIKPLAPATSVAGRRRRHLPLRPGRQSRACSRALAIAQPGDILVAATDGFTATVGDRRPAGGHGEESRHRAAS